MIETTFKELVSDLEVVILQPKHKLAKQRHAYHVYV